MQEPFPSVVLIAHEEPAELRLPKGRVDPGETCEQAARREVLEETGISGNVGRWVGTASWTYSFDGQELTKHVDYFLMNNPEWTGSGLDPDVRGIVMASPSLALKLLSFTPERDILAQALTIVEREL